MALTMLDYLFDREVQAISNLSGHGLHHKNQLDPLFIYGIKCKETTAVMIMLRRFSFLWKYRYLIT